VTALDKKRGKAWMKVPEGCCEGSHGFTNLGVAPFQATEVQWPADGVASVLLHAVHVGNIEVADALLSRGVHIACLDYDTVYHPMLRALSSRRYDMIKLLLEYKADWGLVANENCNACIASKPYREVAIMRLHAFSSGENELATFVPRGVLAEASEGTMIVTPETVNFKDAETGLSSLMLAAARGRVELVRLLIQERANVDAESNDGCTPLSFAADCTTGQTGADCMEALIAAKANLQVRAGRSHERSFFSMHGQKKSAGYQCLPL
jgi:ankyrin repeat protein